MVGEKGRKGDDPGPGDTAWGELSHGGKANGITTKSVPWRHLLAPLLLASARCLMSGKIARMAREADESGGCGEIVLLGFAFFLQFVFGVAGFSLPE